MEVSLCSSEPAEPNTRCRTAANGSGCGPAPQGRRSQDPAPLVCYWFHKAGKLVADSKIARTGLVATNSIRGGRNRTVLDRIVEDSVVFDAWSDEPWVVDGAAVRVSLICFGTQHSGLVARLNGSEASRINADLTAAVADLTRAKRLAANRCQNGSPSHSLSLDVCET